MTNGNVMEKECIKRDMNDVECYYLFCVKRCNL